MSELLEARRFALGVGAETLKLSPTALSHGYQSMVAWISDLLGHAFLEFGEQAHPSTLRGIVLLDEIDLHLHPTWQRRIVPILKRVFPELQFIVTTHSHLVLSGFESDEIISLALENGLVVQRPSPFEPGILSATEVLTGYFGVPRAGRPDLVRKEQEYLDLKARKDRTEIEDSRMRALEEELSRYWMGPPDPFTAPDDDADSVDHEPAAAEDGE